MRWNVPECRHEGESSCRMRACRYFLPRVRSGEPCALSQVKAHPDGMSLRRVAACVGLSAERVRQLEARALVKLTRGGSGGFSL